jgi:hypothetical protein
LIATGKVAGRLKHGRNNIALLATILCLLYEHQSNQTKDYKIGMFCYSSKHAALRSKVNDCWAPDQDNMSEWSVMSVREREICALSFISINLYSFVLFTMLLYLSMLRRASNNL